jgi:hypothetical protein
MSWLLLRQDGCNRPCMPWPLLRQDSRSQPRTPWPLLCRDSRIRPRTPSPLVDHGELILRLILRLILLQRNMLQQINQLHCHNLDQLLAYCIWSILETERDCSEPRTHNSNLWCRL